MPKLLSFLMCLGALAAGEEFSIQIASPVAAQSYQMKRSAFVFRTVGCAADMKPEVNATAEGRVEGQRRSVPLKVAAASTPGVFGIFREWPGQGAWIVNIQGRCGSASATALVATDARGLVRDSSTVLRRAATEADIEASLKKVPAK
jgi:hypothetical protein